mgnify:CR=1 FL=1
MPLVLRPLPLEGAWGDDILDATSPYGYPAPLFTIPGEQSGDAADNFARCALEALASKMRDLKVICAFVRLHPLLDSRQNILANYGEIVHNGRTVYIDLAGDESELWRQTRGAYRRDMAKLKERGVSAFLDAHCSRLNEFVDIYHKTMQQVGAEQRYFFSKEYFAKLKDALGQKLVLGYARRATEESETKFAPDEKIAAAGLFTECCSIVQYHLSGSDPDSPDKDATKLILHLVRSWAKERGNRLFHLGGGLGAKQDSLFFFKSGFSKLTADFYTWRVIFEREIYDAVTKQAQKTASPAPSAANFFPAYRI